MLLNFMTFIKTTILNYALCVKQYTTSFEHKLSEIMAQ